MPNNRVGAVRVNLASREPDGVLSADEAEAVLSVVEAELRALRHVDSEEFVVADVLRTAERFAGSHHEDLPDMLVLFRRDLGELESVTGPTIGRIDAPFRRPDYARTGDHTDQSLLWAVHETTLGPIDLGTIHTVDIAPSLLQALDVDPGAVDGNCHPALSSLLRGSNAGAA